MVKKVLLPIGLVACAASIGTAALQNVEFSHNLSIMRSAPSEYVLNLNSSNKPSGLTSDYQDNFSGTVTTTNGNSVSMSFVNARLYSTGFAELASHGKIYNFSTTDSAITAVTGVELTGSGSLTFKPGILTSNGGILPDITPFDVSAGGGKVTVPACDYFEIEAGDSGAQITSLKLTYTCSETAYDVKMLNGTYTGTGDDGSIYKLTVTNGSATFESLDKQTNVSYSGSASLSSKTAASLSFSSGSITYNMTYDGHGLTFVSKTGSVAQVSFTRVYNVEDFQSYSASGQGWASNRGASSQYDNTGAKAAYYADYHGSNTIASPIGGSGWSLMGSTDYITYNSQKGHNSTKTVAFKGNSNELRYITMNSYYGVRRIIGKGTTFSFWAKGPYSNTNFNTNASLDAAITVHVFYSDKITSSNVGTAKTTEIFDIHVGTDWTKYTMQLDSNKTYYGFAFVCKQSATTYTMIDDVKIYSADPDATYHAAVPTPEGTFKGSGTIGGSSVPIIIALGNVTNGLAYVIISDTNASATGFTFNTNNNQVSITTTGSFNNKTIGTITGTFNSAAGTITSLAFSGTLSVSNGSVTNVSSSELFFGCDGTTSQLQAQFKRRYMSGSWQVDTSNADRITSNTVEFVSGTGAVKRRGYSGGAVALNFQNDFSSAKTVSNIHFWVYNPSGSNITLRMWGYKATNFGSNFETGSVTATAGQWTYCHMGFTSAAIYNFQIADFNNTGVYLTFDNIYLY